MRILLVSTFFPPQHEVASLRADSFARTWAGEGEDVTVLTTAKRHDQGGLERPRDGFRVVEIPVAAPRVLESLRERSRDAPATTAAAIDHDHAPNPPAPAAVAVAPLRRLRARAGFFSGVRMPDLTDWWVPDAVRWARENGPWDVVASSSGPYTTHLVARELRRAGAAGTWMADFRDLWTDNPVYRGLPPFSWRERSLERAVLRAADLVTTVSDGLARALRAIVDRPVEIVTNGFDPRDLASLDSTPAFPDDGARRLVYTGTWYPDRQRPRPLCRALADLARADEALARRLRVVVAGPDAERWRRLAREEHVHDQLELRGRVSRDDALRLQRDAHALLFFDWADGAAGVLTGKLFEYLGATAPVLAFGPDPASAAGDLLTRSGRGAHLGESPDAIRDALASLARGRPLPLPRPRDETYLATLTRDHQARVALSCLRRAAATRV